MELIDIIQKTLITADIAITIKDDLNGKRKQPEESTDENQCYVTLPGITFLLRKDDLRRRNVTWRYINLRNIKAEA